MFQADLLQVDNAVWISRLSGPPYGVRGLILSIILSKLLPCLLSSTVIPQWGTGDADIKAYFAENLEPTTGFFSKA